MTYAAKNAFFSGQSALHTALNPLLSGHLVVVVVCKFLTFDIFGLDLILSPPRIQIMGNPPVRSVKERDCQFVNI